MQRFPGGSLGTPLRPYHPVTGGLLGKTGLIGQRVMGEDRVVPGGAGAVGVLTGGGVLLKGHRQVQVLLSGGGWEVRAWVALENDSSEPQNTHFTTTKPLTFNLSCAFILKELLVG